VKYDADAYDQRSVDELLTSGGGGAGTQKQATAGKLRFNVARGTQTVLFRRWQIIAC